MKRDRTEELSEVGDFARGIYECAPLVFEVWGLIVKSRQRTETEVALKKIFGVVGGKETSGLLLRGQVDRMKGLRFFFFYTTLRYE